jgi:hypothetical protein
MESLNAVKTNSLIAIELSQLQKQLRQVSENRELCDGEFAGALKPQIAISEILRVIPSPPTDIQPMLDAHTDSLGSTIPVKARTGRVP